jgi:hypothetical protein
MAVQQLNSWREFKETLNEYWDLPSSRRRQFIFRGQGDAEWKLSCSLDSHRSFRSDAERSDVIAHLIKEFKRETRGLLGERCMNDLEWELLGRHHGLASTILDWTESPYVAAFFAFSNAYLSVAHSSDDRHVAIWVLDRERFLHRDIREIEVIDDDNALAFNPRAIEQRGLFLRIRSAATPVEELLGDSLLRFEIPLSERKAALGELDEMLLNSRTLFRDFGGAASTANDRVLTIRAK